MICRATSAHESRKHLDYSRKAWDRRRPQSSTSPQNKKNNSSESATRLRSTYTKRLAPSTTSNSLPNTSSPTQLWQQNHLSFRPAQKGYWNGCDRTIYRLVDHSVSTTRMNICAYLERHSCETSQTISQIRA